MKHIIEKYKTHLNFLISIVFFASLFTLLFNINNEAQAAESSSVSPAISYNITGSTSIDSNITIYINASNASNIYGASLDLLFNDDLLEVTNVELGSLFKGKSIQCNPLVKVVNKSGKTSIATTLLGSTKLSNTSGSLFIISAKVKDIGSLYLKTTKNSSSLNASDYNVCLKLSAPNGVKLNYTSSKLYTKFTAPIITAGEYQDNHNSLIYKGSWTSINSSNYSGGSINFANQGGSSLKFSFSGTSFKLYGLKTKMYGKATVNIDGTNVATIDSYNSSTLYNALLFSSDRLTNGTHNVVITTTGTKNPSSTSTDFAVDRLVIEEEAVVLKPGTYQDDNSSLIYTGSWTPIASSNYGGGSIKLARGAGSSLKFNFSGTSFKLYGLKTKMYGKATVNIDGKDVATIDSYNSSTLYNALLYSSDQLQNGTHKVIITTTGTKNPSSSSTDFVIDNIVIENIGNILKPGTYQDDNSSLTYTGSWFPINSSNYNGGSIKLARGADSSVKFTFSGTSFQVYGLKTSMYGKAIINIDGKDVTTIDSYNSSTLYNTLLYCSDNLNNGNHTVTITTTGTKNSNSSSTDFTIDRIVISSTPFLRAGSYEENNDLLSFEGMWGSVSSSNYSNGAIMISKKPGSTLSFSFLGNSLEIYGLKTKMYGIATINIDGKDMATMDCYNPSTMYNTLLYSCNSLTNDIHKVIVTCMSTKNANSSSTDVAIDKVIVK